MMKAEGRLIVCVFTALVVNAAVMVAATAYPDVNSWNDSVVVTFIEDGAESNSGILGASLKIRRETQSNRLEMAFMIDVDNYEGPERTGIEFNLNSLGTVVIKGNGTIKYDENAYYADVQFDDDTSGTITYYVTLGVKDGYGDSVDITVSFFDCKGVRSNTYRRTINFVENSTSSMAASLKNAEKEKIAANTNTSSKSVKNNTQSDSGTFAGYVGEETQTALNEYYVSGTDIKFGEANMAEKPTLEKSTIVAVAGSAALVCGGAIFLAKRIKQGKH